MKKLSITLLLFAMAAMTFAVPARRGLSKTVTLADGTKVKVELRGDEHGHYWQSADGVRYVASEMKGIYKVADMEAIRRNASARRKTMSAVRAKKMAKAAKTSGAAKASPAYTGTKKGLLILAQFPDKKFESSHNLALYKQIVNGQDYSDASLGFRGSVRDYFHDQSDGQFDFDIDVVGPVTVSKNYAYYGGNNLYGDDNHPEEMVAEACKLADATVNFKDYDWDGDGEVDQIFVLYAGHGEASWDDEDTIWPHAWTLEDAADITLTLDGVRINSYACSCELGSDGKIDGIGTICHEFSHCFGLMDMYDTSYSGNFGMCSWSLMDSGGYNSNGFVPAGYTSFEKMSVGWKQPIEMTGDMEVQNLKPYSDGGEAYILYNEANRNEFFLLENRQYVGWDAGLEDNGLLAIHVDYDAGVWAYNEVNTTVDTYSGNNHQRCTVIPADGVYDSEWYEGTEYFYGSGDPFKQATATSLTNSTKYASLYNANTDGTKRMNKSVTGITLNSDRTMSFNLKLDNTGGNGGDNPSPGESLFYESFNDCDGTGGNDDLWSGNIASADFTPDNEGWTAESSYGGNCCARFGASKKSGVATTPSFSIDGTTTFTFRAAPWSSDGTTLTLSASNGATISPSSFTMKSNQWTDFTATITGTGNVKVTFTPTKRFFLDEVKASAPSQTGIKGITANPSDKRADNKIYTLDGRFVGTDASVLPRGIYVIAGKKIVK